MNETLSPKNAPQSGPALLDHEYDGIREYDNPTPGWWHALFLASIVFSIAYLAWYHFSVFSMSEHEKYDAVVTRELQKQFRELGDLAPDEPTIARLMSDPKWLKVAEGSFRAQCVSCHGASGEGSIGPNLTDDSYKNVKSLADIAHVISEGAANGAMPAWRTRFHRNEIVLLSAYVAALRGQNLPGPRGAEGEVIAPWPAAQQDSTTAETQKTAAR